MRHFWFKRKQYGWGWQPASKEGWIVTALYLVAIIAAASHFLTGEGGEGSFEKFIGFTFVSVVLFIVIAWKTGEPPRWQWGGGREEKEKKGEENSL